MHGLLVKCVSIVLITAAMGCALADSVKLDSTVKMQSIPQYKLRHDPLASTGEVCDAFLNVLNATHYETLYQDIFLNVLKGKEGFESMDWQYIEDGEERYGEIPFAVLGKQKTSEYMKNNFPNGYKTYREMSGKFSYYIIHADIFDDKNPLPILFYIKEIKNDVDKRRGFSYVVMDSGMKLPDQRSYMHQGILTSSYSMQPFLYKGRAYVLDSSMQDRISILEIYHSIFSCSYDLIK